MALHARCAVLPFRSPRSLVLRYPAHDLALMANSGHVMVLRNPVSMTPPAAQAPRSSEPSPPDSLVGQILSDRYRIESRLGEGGMGAVYLAEHVLMHKRLAIKVLHQEMTRMPEVVARFEREAMAAAHIEHPNVAAATDFGKLQDGSFFLVLEYIEGQSLREVVAKGPMPVARVLRIAHQIAAGLGRAHALGIVHRDLKPENVMLVEREGEPDFVKVLDFGIAKVPVGELSHAGSASGAKEALTQLGMVYGTPEYMAPEQALGQLVDSRADLYALGVMMFEMLAGARPFDADSKVALLGMKVTRDAPTIRSKNAEVDVPDTVETIVAQLLAKEPAKRLQRARDVIDALERSRLGEAVTEPPPSPGRSRRAEGGSPPSGAALSPAAGAASGESGSLGTSVSSGEVRVRAPGIPLRARLSTLRSACAGKLRSLGLRLQPSGKPWLTDLPAAIRQTPSSFRKAPAPLLMGTGLLLVVACVMAARAWRSAPPITVQPLGSVAVAPAPTAAGWFKPAAPATVTAEELAGAVATGAAALEELSAKYPKDPSVWRALIESYSAAKRHVDAMHATSRLAELGEAAVNDDGVHDAFVAAVLGGDRGLDTALALVEGPLGTKGPDWLYELFTQRKLSPKLNARLKQHLAKADVRSHASPALLVALDLKSSSGCEAKKALLPKAREYGDPRSLQALQALRASNGCGFLGLHDCWSCLRGAGLESTITAVAARGGDDRPGGDERAKSSDREK